MILSGTDSRSKKHHKQKYILVSISLVNVGVVSPFEMSREQARMLAIERCGFKKKTAQYTLTGELVKVWESTAEIQREFGWSDSSIQRACRGERRTSHGFVWRYVG